MDDLSAHDTCALQTRPLSRVRNQENPLPWLVRTSPAGDIELAPPSAAWPSGSFYVHEHPALGKGKRCPTSLELGEYWRRGLQHCITLASWHVAEPQKIIKLGYDDFDERREQACCCWDPIRKTETHDLWVSRFRRSLSWTCEQLRYSLPCSSRMHSEFEHKDTPAQVQGVCCCNAGNETVARRCQGGKAACLMSADAFTAQREC